MRVPLVDIKPSEVVWFRWDYKLPCYDRLTDFAGLNRQFHTVMTVQCFA